MGTNNVNANKMLMIIFHTSEEKQFYSVILGAFKVSKI
ncbi:hypothetical protein PPHE_a3936 [Pseudoalteromonas phenolica O-BC30]|nr:hypothetical protein [Pseudoalteromonas phenolica O-BC30]